MEQQHPPDADNFEETAGEFWTRWQIWDWDES